MLDNIRLLVVDNDKDVIIKMKQWFKESSKVFFTASTSEEAHEIMNMKDFDVLITEIDLPGNDGFELIRKSRELRPHIQCIIMTENCTFETALTALKIGVADYLKKPSDKNIITLSIKQVMAKKTLIKDLQMRILTVEDSSSAMDSLVKMLNGLGYHNVIKADNGELAIKKIKEDKDIKLVISDWYMPLKNGFELLRWLRSKKETYEIPFIMASADGEKKQVIKASKEGANTFLIKPFGRRDLRNAINEALGRKIIEPDTKKKAKIKTTSKATIKVAYIPITDHLILGVLSHLIKNETFKPNYFNMETKRLFHWYPIQKDLEMGNVDAAFILAPIAMDLFSYGIPIKTLLLAHKNGSICVRNAQESIDNKRTLIDFFTKTTFFLPHLLSVQHILSHKFFRHMGLNPGFIKHKSTNLFYEVVPPILMPDYQAADKNVSGFMVAEPIGSKAIDEEFVKLLFLSGELWANHPCCVLSMRDDFIEKHTDAVYEFIELLVKAGNYIQENPEKTSEIAIKYMDPDDIIGLKRPVLEKVLKEPFGIKTNDLFPRIEDFDIIQKYLHDEIGVGTVIDPEKLVDLRFAENAYKNIDYLKKESKFQDISALISRILSR